MKKICKIVLLVGVGFGSVGLAQTTQIYTGTIKDLAGNPVTSGQVTFTLSASVDATIPGVGRFTPFTINCNINADGSLSGYVGGVGSGACTVQSNTSLSPGGTAYRICEQPYYQTPGVCFYDYALGGTKDISSVVPTLPTGPVNYSGIPGPQGATGASGCLLGTNCTTSMTPQTMDGVANATLYSGSDIGAQINSAEAALAPSGGGTIYIPARSTCYTFTTAIVMVSGIHIEGSGRLSTCMQYTASAGVAITAANNSSLSDLSLAGPGGTNTATGLRVSGFAFFLKDVILGGFTPGGGLAKFHVGLTFGNNAYVDTFINLQAWENDQNMVYPAGLTNSGENIQFVGGQFSNGGTFANCVQNGVAGSIGSGELEFDSVSFDSCQLVNNEGILRMHGGHFEDGGVVTGLPFLVTYGSNIGAGIASTGTYLDGVTVFNDATPSGIGQFEVSKYGALHVSELADNGSSAIPLFYLDAGAGGGNTPYLQYVDLHSQRTASQTYGIAASTYPILDVTSMNVSIHTSSGSRVSALQGAGTLYGKGSAIAQKGSILGLYAWSGSGSSWFGSQIRALYGGGLQLCNSGFFTFTSYDALTSETSTCASLPSTPSTTVANDVATYGGTNGQALSDSGVQVSSLCRTSGANCPAQNVQFMGYFVTTAAASDTITAATTGMLASMATLPAPSHCFTSMQNSIGAGLTGVYVPNTATVGTITVFHSATAGGNVNVYCALE